MLILNLTLDSPAENLALDEALLQAAEDDLGPGEVLRLWEPRQTFVVLGSSSRWKEETNIAACSADGVPILRRPSGGAAIVTGLGCLMYAIVLSYERHPRLQAIDEAHQHVLGRLAESIGRHVPGVRQAGISDLCLAIASSRGTACERSGGISSITARCFMTFRCRSSADIWPGRPASRNIVVGAGMPIFWSICPSTEPHCWQQ